MIGRFTLSLLAALVVLVSVGFTGQDADARVTKRLPTFDMKDLEERDHSLTHERYKGKVLLIAAFSTWQQSSIDQALELEKFHKANPDVQIIAFICNELSLARDFRAQHGLTFPCYKGDGNSFISSSLNRLFKTRTGRTLTLNRVPFVIMTDKDRNVEFAELGLVDAAKLGEARRAIAD